MENQIMPDEEQLLNEDQFQVKRGSEEEQNENQGGDQDQIGGDIAAANDPGLDDEETDVEEADVEDPDMEDADVEDPDMGEEGDIDDDTVLSDTSGPAEAYEEQDDDDLLDSDGTMSGEEEEEDDTLNG